MTSIGSCVIARANLPPAQNDAERNVGGKGTITCMDASERIRLMHDTFATFLLTAARSVISGTPSPYLVFEACPFEEEYVQIKLFGDYLVGEVGAREWTDIPRPFSAMARGFLAASGFIGGGQDCNYACEQLPLDPNYLTGMVESLFYVYELGECYGLMVKRYDGRVAE